MKKLALTDFAKYRYPSALELSPDGRYLTFALKEVDREGDGYRWNLWLYDLESRESRQITQGDDQRKAVWEDNTHILYKTTEPDEAMRARGFEEEWTVYHRLNVCTGEEREAFRLPMSVSGLWKMDEGRYVFTGETHLDRPNLLELTGEALEKELVRRQQTKGYKVLTELPLCENGVGMFNQTRITLFLYLEATGEYRRITPEDYDVNHVNVRPGQVLFTAFPFRDIKPVTEGMYRWDAERNETETLITPDKYSIDYVGHLGRKALCLGLVMRDYGVYEHPTFFVVDENGEVHRIGCPNAPGVKVFPAHREHQPIGQRCRQKKQIRTLAAHRRLEPAPDDGFFIQHIYQTQRHRRCQSKAQIVGQNIQPAVARRCAVHHDGDDLQHRDARNERKGQKEPALLLFI